MTHALTIGLLQKGMPVIACVAWAPDMRLRLAGNCADRRNGQGWVPRQIVPTESPVFVDKVERTDIKQVHLTGLVIVRQSGRD